jgi:hypothetical protein
VKSFRELREERLAAEQGTIYAQAELPIALVYPSPYHVGMSSLGFQTIYRELNALPGVAAERAFLPDDVADAARPRESLCTYESNRPSPIFPSSRFRSATSWSWPAWFLPGSGRHSRRCPSERDVPGRRWPLVVVGGPLTFSNPVPAGPMADVIVMGEAEEAWPRWCRPFATARTNARCWKRWPSCPASSCRSSTASVRPPSSP